MRDFSVAEGLYILLNYVFHTNSITSVLQASSFRSCWEGGAAAVASEPPGLSGTPTCQGGQHKRSDHIAWAGLALQAESKHHVSEVPQVHTVRRRHISDYLRFHTKGDSTHQEMTWMINLQHFSLLCTIIIQCLRQNSLFKLMLIALPQINLNTYFTRPFYPGFKYAYFT